MTSSGQLEVRSKRIAQRIAMMIDARLIWYEHYYPWADHLIAELDEPPNWILEISTIKYYPDAVTAVNRFAYSEPFEEFELGQRTDEQIACLYLRSQAGAISWATFLEEAGACADNYSAGLHECEFFYQLLSELTDHEYAAYIESRQRAVVVADYRSAIATIQPLYDMFMGYFREYVGRRR